MLPLAITAYVLWWVFNALDNLLGRWVEQLWGVHIPGLGAVALLVFVFLVGLIATNVIGSRLIALGERILARIPVVRSVYGNVKQVIEAFAVPNRDVFHRVVLVEYPRRGTWVVGLVTGRLPERPQGIPEDMITLFLPNTPNPTSGVLVLVPESDCVTVEMSVQEAFKSVVSMGVVLPDYLRARNTDQATGAQAGGASEAGS